MDHPKNRLPPPIRMGEGLGARARAQVEMGRLPESKQSNIQVFMPWRKVCDSIDLKEGESLEFLVEGNVIAVFRSEGQIEALDGMCAHQGGPLARGTVKNGCVTCPWHGWQYVLCNGHNAVTGKSMLRAYPAKDDGLSVFIDV